MSDALASFRDLKGVGPAIEARLHEAGVYSWQALAEVVDALGSIRRGSGDTLRDLSTRIVEHAAQAGASSSRLPNGERSEAFIVRISLASGGQATRSTVTHVRSQAEKPVRGWSPSELIRFMEEQSGLRTAVVGADAEGPAPSAPTPARARPAPARPAPARPAQRDHTVILDAGKAIGGARRNIELVVVTDQVGVKEFEYRATLSGRAFGQATAPAASWTTLAGHTGRAHPPDMLPLRFEGVDLPRGLQRLRLEVALRLPSPEEGAAGPGAQQWQPLILDQEDPAVYF